MIGPSKEVAEAYLQYTLQEVYGDTAKLQSTSSTADRPEISEVTEEEPDNAAIDYGSRAHVQDNYMNATGWKTGTSELMSVSLEKLEPGSDNIFNGGEKVRMVVRAKAHDAIAQPILGFLVRDRLGQDLFGENTLPFT